MKIYLKLDKKPENIIELLYALFSYGIDTSNTVTNVITYNDEECQEIQCDCRKYRSFDDIFDIVNTYFPETPVEEVFKSMLILNIKNTDKKSNLYPWLYRCSTIKRIVFCYNYNKSEQEFSSEKYESKYNWVDLMTMIGIKNQQELKNYINDNRLKDKSIIEKILEKI